MIAAVPLQRLSVSEVQRQHANLDADKLGLHILEELPTPMVLVNRTHQIVYANRALRGMTSEDLGVLLGLRPGEVLGCENSTRAEGGCGCAEACSTCGAVRAIMASLQGEPTTNECRITRQGDDGMDAMDLRIHAHPMPIGGESYALLHVADISAEKRRQNLEKIFFHDILNVVGSIRGFAEILLDYNLENPREIFEQIHEASQQMVDEIEAQRMLSRAEHGDLDVQREPLESLQVLERVVTLLKGHEVAHGRQVVIGAGSCRDIFLSDPMLLVRSLINLAKNALEATPVGGTVTLGCERLGDALRFEVHNDAVIPHEIQLQIFQRSFSTKGCGRGIGTYSVRLLVERYLAGKVSFVSDKTVGSRFFIALPA